MEVLLATGSLEALLDLHILITRRFMGDIRLRAAARRARAMIDVRMPELEMRRGLS
jgi:hypothetical protein